MTGHGDLPGDPQTLRASPEILIECRDLSAGYGGLPAIEGVSFRVAAGERVAVIGPNGGGKTTLFRAILGELPPLHGSLEVRTRCGVVPQTQRSRLDYPVSALDVALMGSLSRLPLWRRPGGADRRRAMAALEAVDLAALAGESFGALSGGQQQRALIARALMQDARLLLLDEPFTGVDQLNAERLLSLLDDLAAGGRGIVLAIHDLDQGRACDRVLALNHRQLGFGDPEAVLTPEILAETYPGSVVVFSHEGHDRTQGRDPHGR